jgi:molybdate transport system substrate-binding protein
MRHALVFALALGTTAAVQAADVQVLSAAAMQTVLKDVAAAFERSSGHRLVIAYATMGAINDRVAKGEAPDVVIGSSASMTRLVADGRIDAKSARQIARVGVGMLVPATDPKPDIGSVEDLKRALLGARTVVYADPKGGGAAGIHVAKVIDALALGAQMKPKTRYGAGGDVTEVTLALGSGALGLTQISEIVGKPGAAFAGPLPPELQNYTGVTAGVPAGAGRSEAASAFLEFLRSPVVAAALQAHGMEAQ